MFLIGEIQLEFLWHTALRASEDYAGGVSECMMHGDLLTRMHITADLRIAKDSLHLNQPMREL